MDPSILFVCIVIFWLIALAILLGDSSLKDLAAHWDDRRCDIDGLFFASLVKPKDDTRSPSEFSKANFKFCIGNKSKGFLQTQFGNLFATQKKQMGVTEKMARVLDDLKKKLGMMFRKFQDMTNRFWAKFQIVGAQASRVFQTLYMTMKKGMTLALAGVYIGLSLQTLVFNIMDFVIKVIVIFLWILSILAIIFFIPIIPVMFLTFMAVNGIESVFPGKTGALGSIFCFAPGTQVLKKAGDTASIESLKVGDVLRDGQTVEAVIELDGPAEALYDIDGVSVSGDHRIWNATTESWDLVKDYKGAERGMLGTSRLWTLITSNRQIPVKGSQKEHVFADWEEMPEEMAELWEELAATILNSEPSATPTCAPVLESSTRVKSANGWKQISQIRVGDWVWDGQRFTKVLGKGVRQAKGGLSMGGTRVTDGVWIKFSSSWMHPKGVSDTTAWEGEILLTDSGRFQIQTADGSSLTVRDFTEVGWANLDRTYAPVEEVMVAGQ